MSKQQYDLVAKIGEYEQNGETKNRYHRCGTGFVDDDGGISIKIDAVPVTEWNGWLSLYPKKEYNAQQRPSSEPVRRQPAAASSNPDQDDIPF